MKGKLKIKTAGSAAFDTDGNPIETAATYGSEIECKYEATIPNRNDLVDIGDGTYTQASFIITVRDMTFDAKIIQLIDNRNKVVCEKDVKNLEVLESIRRVKIVV